MRGIEATVLHTLEVLAFSFLPRFFVGVSTIVAAAFNEFLGQAFVASLLSLEAGDFVVWKFEVVHWLEFGAQNGELGGLVPAQR